MFQRLIEKMELHNELNPKLWDGNKLRPEVEDKIEDIIDQFIIELQENEIPIKILDVRLVGSNASFNYTENSDLDIHIIANFEDTSCDVPVLNLLYNFFKKNFNDKYTISIHGVPIELYVEDVNSSAVSNGVYSIFGRKWIKFPEPIEVPDIDITDIFAPYEERYNEIMEHKDVEAASSLIDDLYLLRKDSISTDGEYGEGNLVFKEFRNKGYLDNLKQLLVDETSKELSLESLNEMVMLEGRDAPLYHGTQISNFIDILKTDTLKPGRIYNRDIKAGREHGSISLSRNKSAATEYGDVVFTLDQSKLSDNYKITPVGDFENKYGTTHARKINNGKAEEIITEPITPLHKYLKKIEILVPENQLSGYKHIIDDYVNKFNTDIKFVTSESLYVMNESKENNNIDKDKIFNFIENNFRQSNYPDTGPGYILPDGYFLVLGHMGAHIEVDDVLFENGLVSEDPYSYNYPYPNLILVDEFNAIRYNDGENLGGEYGNPYIQLPKKKPTYEQFDSLESWIGDLDFDKNLFVDGVEYNLKEVNPNYIIKKIKNYYTTGMLQENLILEDKESQKLFQAFQHYLGTRRERISNPSGSGINKGKDIQDAKHHNDNAHGGERADDIEIKNFRKHSSDHYKSFQNAFNQFMEEVKKLLPNISNVDLTMLINKISDEASAKMFKDKPDAIADKYEQYSDKLDDLKSLLDDIRARYRNNEFDVRLTESRNHMDFEEMVEQAAVRHPKPEDIFEKPWDKLVDPKTFFDKLTSNASKEYKANTRKRIVKTDSTQSFYKTILGYLDSLSINKEYPKLEPASYQIKMGEFVPVDGRHRAQLCLMLGMPLPVREIKHDKLEESKHSSFNALAYHGSDTKFDKFDISKAGTHDAGQWGKGIYFTNKKEIASNFGGKYIYTCRINLKNPYYVETENDIADYIALAEDNDQVTEILKEQGYDGVISKNETWYNPQDIMSPLIADQYVVFDPKDIEILEVKEILDESLKDNKKLDDIISKLLIENPNNYKLGKATDLEPNAPYFILPNGKILYGMYNHLEVEQDLHSLNLSNYQNTEYDDLDYNDSTLFDLGCIRGRYSSDIFNDMGYVLLTKGYPTLSQFDSLGEIIAKAKSERIDDIEFMNYNESKYHDYELREYEPEDIIKKLKRFYASGKFYEGLDEDWVKNFIPVDNYYNSQKLNEAEDSGDWGYHYGDLGNKSDRRGNFGGRNSGGFGTGTYFVGTPISQRDDGSFYKNRPEHKVDFSKYHLFKPSTNEAAYNLHDALLAFNNMEPDFKEEPPSWDEVLAEFEKVSNEYWAPLDNLDDESPSTPVKLNTKPLLQYIRKYINYYPYKITKDDNLMDIAQDIEKELIKEASSFEKSLHNLSSALHYYDEDKLRKIVVTALKDKSDKAPSTLIMQALGYDGIDVRHLNHDAQGLAGLDNFGFGSVIYNLKEGIEETGKSSIKAIIFTTDEKPRKNILPFKDFTIDGIYSLGENTYIAFEKRWEYDPRGISFIHADVADDYILPYFPNFTENMQTQDAYIEMDNFQFPNIFTNIDEIKNGIYSKYYPLILQELNKWFR